MRIAPRREVHGVGLWHRTAHVWLIHPTAIGGSVLFQKRSDSKDVAPGLFDVSVGGHVDPGEEPIQAAVRETREELGLGATEAELRPLGIRQTAGVFGEKVDCEFQHVYTLVREFDPAALMFDPIELAGVVLLPLDDAIAVLSGAIPSVQAVMHTRDAGGARGQVPVSISRDDFVPSVDGYRLRGCLAARRILDGDPLVLV